VRSPSLPAALVDTIFRHLGSPMVGTGQAVEDAARAQHIDDAFALAVWWTETNDGAAGVGLHDHNPGSVRGSTGYPSAFDGYTIYPSFSAAVTYWFGMLKRVYINRGLTTVFAIAHPYVGTSTSNLWAGKVITLMNRYRAEAPQQPATPTATSTPATNTINATSATTNMTRHAKALLQQDQAQGTSIVPQTLDANTPQASTSGLNGNVKLLLVLFDLLAALGIGLFARSMLKRYANNTRIAHLLSDNLQAGFQPVAAGSWRTTENLTWPEPMTGALTTTNVALITTEKWPQVQMPATPSYPQTGHLPGLGTPSHAMQHIDTSTPNPWHRTRLLPTRPITNQQPPVAVEPQPQLVGVGVGSGRSHGLLSRYREEQGEQSQGL
jgi:hypothetical protein